MRQLTHPKLRGLLQLTKALILSHLPYSSDLAPSDFYLYSKLKTKLCGRRFGSNEGVMEAVNEFFEDQNREFCFEGLNKLEHRWENALAVVRSIN
jgi:histone-lysine N-methyltransferase SETMAR